MELASRSFFLLLTLVCSFQTSKASSVVLIDVFFFAIFCWINNNNACSFVDRTCLLMLWLEN